MTQNGLANHEGLGPMKLQLDNILRTVHAAYRISTEFLTRPGRVATNGVKSFPFRRRSSTEQQPHPHERPESSENGVLESLRDMQRRCGRLSRTHKQASAERTSAAHERQNFIASLQHLESSLRKLCESLDGFPGQQGEQSTTIFTVLQHSAAVRKRASRIQDFDNALIDLDEDLDQHSKNLLEAAELLVKATGPPQKEFSAGVSSRSSSVSQRPASETSPLLVSYFDRRGDVSLYIEQLFDLDREYKEHHQEAEIERDRNDGHVAEDLDFEEYYRSERENIIRELRRAEEDTENLKAQCVLQGLDTTNDRSPTSDIDQAENHSLSGGWYHVVSDWVEQVP